MEDSEGLKKVVSFYSNYLWNRVTSFLPSKGSYSLSSALIPRGRRKRCQARLPLPLPYFSSTSDVVISHPHSHPPPDVQVLQDIMDHVLINLHAIQKSLQFWQCRAEGSAAQKLNFMILERGPRGFVDAVLCFLPQSHDQQHSSLHILTQSASAYISERILVLSSLRSALATFLAEIYTEVDKCGEKLLNDPQKSLPSLLATINALFLNLEASIGHLHALRQTDSSVDGSSSFPLLFHELPEVNKEQSQWTDCETSDATKIIYKNLDKMATYLSHMVAKHQKPSRATQYWIHYTCGAVGLSFCSFWLLQHSSLMGSSDIDNWINKAWKTTSIFYHDHVEQPFVAIKDDLFDTFRKRHKGVMDTEEVQLTSDSLHRMLLAFSEQTKGEKLPENASEQAMLEIVMARYEQELAHPIKNIILGGELARALLIQVQKLKRDIETAMLELDQILKANEINFALLAFLPTLFISLGLLRLVPAWFKQDARAEGRGRMAQRQRRLLLVEVEKRIMQYQAYIDQGMEKESQCMFGLVLYGLDRLLRAVERHGKETGEWQWLKQDIIDLGRPNLQTAYKLLVTSRMARAYESLLPSLKR